MLTRCGDHSPLNGQQMGVVVFQRSLTCRADGYTTRANEGHAGWESAEAVDEDGDEHEGANTDGWECEK